MINSVCLSNSNKYETCVKSPNKGFTPFNSTSPSLANQSRDFVLRSTPRRTIYSENNLESEQSTNRKRGRQLSGLAQFKSVPISPQIFDEEAMFLGRDEFLIETTPKMTSVDGDDGDEAELFLLSQ